MARCLPRREEIARRFSQSEPESAPIHGVGGGDGGVEVAFCLDARLRKGKTPSERVEIVIGEEKRRKKRKQGTEK